MATFSYPVQVICCSSRRSSFLHSHSRTSLSSSISLKPLLKELNQNPIFHQVSKIIKDARVRLFDAFVDLAFDFVDQELLPSQSNFAPVEEIEKAVQVTESIHGRIPDDFPEGAYIRNGPNPLFGGLKSTNSIFGKSSHTWIEGEGMLHALYFSKDANGSWKISYNNKHVQTDTFKLEKDRKKPAFLPALEGDSHAVLAAYLLNWLRFGLVNKYLSNTNVFQHSGKFYSVSENHAPQEIDIPTLETQRNWDINGAWKRPFTSHPKKAPGTGELVIMGVHPNKPYFELGVVSADGKKLLHKMDLNLKRCCLCHEIGVTRRYNVIMDFPLILDINRLISGGPLMKYNKEGYARIGVMPRYGDADSVRWFEVEPGCTFHIINCYEHEDEVKRVIQVKWDPDPVHVKRLKYPEVSIAVVVLACRARNSMIPGPDFGLNKFGWFSEGFRKIATLEETNEGSEDESFFSRVYEWRLNMVTGEVAEKNLTGTGYSMEFPMINEKYSGTRNKFGYTQVIDSNASSKSDEIVSVTKFSSVMGRFLPVIISNKLPAGKAKYGGLAKLYIEERKLHLSSDGKRRNELIRVEYHMFPENTFCSGAVFVAKSEGVEEDDGWVITYVHNEVTNTSQVYIVDAKSFSNEPVAKITLPTRVPYGFHGAFVPLYPRQSVV